MTCYSPVTLYKATAGMNRETGKWPLVGRKDGYIDKPVKVPCQRCIGCRLERSRQWAIRCVCESQMHRENSFLTLTYDDDHLTYGGASHGILVPEHLQRFWRALRKPLRKRGKRIRYFACGEYGDQSNRPHYHACLFGFDFPDKTLHSTKDGVNLYRSDYLDSLWGHGLCVIGDVTFESAAYVARYVMKKRLGKDADTYSAQGISPEFVVMSRRPGIGSTWLEKFQSDVFPHDYMVVRNGIKSKPPKFFTNKYALSHPLESEDIKNKRLDEGAKMWAENTPQRLAARERIKKRAIESLKRKLD